MDGVFFVKQFLNGPDPECPGHCVRLLQHLLRTTSRLVEDKDGFTAEVLQPAERGSQHFELFLLVGIWREAAQLQQQPGPLDNLPGLPEL
jgi:hypothetical protein